MKVKFNITYDEGYLPTPRCRKLRYREKEECVEIDIPEVSINSLVPAFDATHYEETSAIFGYKDKLWTVATESDFYCIDRNSNVRRTAIEALVYAGVTFSTYYGKYNYVAARHETKEEVMARLNKDMANYLLVDGVLYKTTSEPMYVIHTFGLGHNHAGIGTSLSVTNYYNCNISHRCYFNALQYEEAVEQAVKTALGRGDTNSVDYIRSLKPIVVHDKKFVTRNPQKDHGDGCEFLNAIESVISGSSSANEAGILAMAFTAAEINK